MLENDMILNHFNYVRGTEYTDLNLEILKAVMVSKGFESNQWITSTQANALGSLIKKGEKGTQLVYVNLKPEKIKAGERTAKTYTVFNIEQVEALPTVQQPTS